MHIRKVLLSVLGGGVLAFGLYNVHSLSGVTEGGALGLTLLLQHWLGLSPALSGLVINFCCYAFGLRTLGKRFLIWSAVSGGSFSAFYAIFERFPQVWPGLADLPLLAAILGALFVGVGIGLCVRSGGAPTGDDALAMGLSARFGIPIERVYLITDLTVLAMSLSYLPLTRIGCSLLTVTLSGKLIGLIQRWGILKNSEGPLTSRSTACRITVHSTRCRTERSDPMLDLTMGAVERRFAALIWDNEPITAAELAKLADKELKWKKTTAYTALKRLCDKGIFRNDYGTVTSVLSRSEYQARQSRRFLDDNCGGSLPAFIAAFTKRGDLSRADLEEIRNMLDEYEKGV